MTVDAFTTINCVPVSPGHCFVGLGGTSPPPGFPADSGTDAIGLGATLHIGANQPVGDYSGPYTVTASYQ